MQEINVQLPDDVYQRLTRMAVALRRPLEEVLVQTIRGNLPPAFDDLLPAEQEMIAVLMLLDDDGLRDAAVEPLSPARWRRHRRLLRKAEEGSLAAAEKDELVTLRAEVDRSVIRRSCALALLKWRGHAIPLAS